MGGVPTVRSTKQLKIMIFMGGYAGPSSRRNFVPYKLLTIVQTIYAVDRAGLNKRLLDILEDMPNVKFFFNHKLTGADFKNRKAWFERRDQTTTSNRPTEIEIDFDFMIGADGAHSAVRYHLMKFTRMNYKQEYIDTLWCEFQIQPRGGSSDQGIKSKFRISPNHLHIWPGKKFMFIAIPSDVRVLRFLSSDNTDILMRKRTAHSRAPCSCQVPNSLISKLTRPSCLPSSTHISQESRHL